MSKESKAAVVAPPISAAGAQDVDATADVDGVLCLATTASNIRVKIPIKWRGRWVNIQSVINDLDIVFGTASTAVAAVNSLSSVSSNVATLVATTGATIFSGTERSWFIPNTDLITDFGFIGSIAGVAATGGFIKMWPSDDVHPGKN